MWRIARELLRSEPDDVGRLALAELLDHAGARGVAVHLDDAVPSVIVDPRCRRADAGDVALLAGVVTPDLRYQGDRLAIAAPDVGVVLDGVSPQVVADRATVEALQTLVELLGASIRAKREARATADRHRRLEALAILDDLTGLYNRRYLDRRLRDELDRCRRYGRSLGFAMIDLDHFRAVNDRHGHLGGDAVLRQFARLTETTMRRPDLIARYGGEEFAILMPEATAAGALRAAERLRAAVAATPFTHLAEVIPLTCSIGVGWVAGGRSVSPDELVASGDAALYLAKQTGRDRVEAGDDLP